LIGIGLGVGLVSGGSGYGKAWVSKFTNYLGWSQSSSCDIKGNISMRTGERIYHVPGQKYYNATRINPGKGERWFCSEWEARKAGWRKARI
jgi:hypothetical protein